MRLGSRVRVESPSSVFHGREGLAVAREGDVVQVALLDPGTGAATTYATAFMESELQVADRPRHLVVARL